MADIFSIIRLSTEKFVDLAVNHVVTKMFPITDKVDKPFFDLYSLSLEETTVSNLINMNFTDDSLFGKAYILFGTYKLTSSESIGANGLIVVLLPSTVKEQFVSVSTMQLIDIAMGSKSFKSKISRRILGKVAEHFVVSEYLSFNVFSDSILFTKGTKAAAHCNIFEWNNGIDYTGVNKVFDTSKFLKRKRVTLISEDTAKSLLEGSDQKLSSSGKKWKNLLRGAPSIYTDVKSTKSNNSSMINLREEAISLVDDAFSESISPEDFVSGYLALKSKCDNRSQLGVISANILMDASFRITDCSSFPNDSIITEAGIDIDQVSAHHNIWH
jgi:hypothetical protein